MSITLGEVVPAGLRGFSLSHRLPAHHWKVLGTEVDGVAGQIALWPSPIGVFDDQTGIGGQDKVTGLAFHQLEAALLDKRDQRGHAGSADLLAR